MGFSLSAAVFAVLQLQSEPIGELAKDEFCNLLTGFGYKASLSNDQNSVSVSDRNQSLQVWISMRSGGERRDTFVGSASCRIEFDLPRSLENKKLLDWQIREKLIGLRMHSFLGGRVVLESNVFYQGQILGKVITNFKSLFEACTKAKRELGKLGGVQTKELYQLGKAPLDLSAKLELVEQEDLDYMREKLGWGKQITSNVIRGWCTGAELMGLPVYFTGMIGPRAGFSIACSGRPDSIKLERWQRYASKAQREEVLIQDGYAHIQTWVDTSGGLTVREVANKILEFAKRVKAMDLF